MSYTQQSHHRLLLDALNSPGSLVGLNTSEWELLIRQARKVKLLGRLAVELNNSALLENIPIRAANQLRSGLIQARKLQQQTHWELNRVLWALQGVEIPVIVLKGVAYALAGLPKSDGRVYVDLDFMVARSDLLCVESTLKQKGWQQNKLSSYDENYYRVWSHEIPPLIHTERETEVDIHHTIAPLTSKLKINTDLFFEVAVVVEDVNTQILSPVDMVLHCAVNLFQNNELSDDLRDLLDIHDLLQFFSNKEADFWKKLIERANQLRLGRPLFYGLHFSQVILKTSIPAAIADKLNERPGRIQLWLMDKLVPLALLPLHPDKPARSALFARFLLYSRSHWIRMPLYLLLPHLTYKKFLSVFPRKAATTEIKK
tara:strand:+ start:862 stop:1977 length:1116 start_codon:yes stop_codon:yes gene_type:complete